jgi:hypothetical protein
MVSILVGAFNDMPVLRTAFHKDKFHNDHIFFLVAGEHIC